MFGDAQKKMQEIKERLEHISVSAEAENGLVVAHATGGRKLKELHISDELLKNPDREQLEELIVVAVNRALEQAEKLSEAEMRAAASQLLPGLGNLFK